MGWTLHVNGATDDPADQEYVRLAVQQFHDALKATGARATRFEFKDGGEPLKVGAFNPKGCCGG